MPGFFVTGTDTDCGKTFIAAALIRAIREKGYSVAPFKPVAAGAEWHKGQLRNQDALSLIHASEGDYPYELVNPYCFEPPIAPHIAAEQQSIEIDSDLLLNAYQQLSAKADYVLVEGAGGWRVPLSQSTDIASLAAQIGLPVILVVGMKLGCISHALLTAESIVAAGVPLAGWIATEVAPDMSVFNQNLQTLKERMPAPNLGVLRYQNDPAATDFSAGLKEFSALLQSNVCR